MKYFYLLILLCITQDVYGQCNPVTNVSSTLSGPGIINLQFDSTQAGSEFEIIYGSSGFVLGATGSSILVVQGGVAGTNYAYINSTLCIEFLDIYIRQICANGQRSSVVSSLNIDTGVQNLSGYHIDYQFQSRILSNVTYNAVTLISNPTLPTTPDTDGNGQISQTEAEQIYFLNLPNKSLNCVKGLEYFTGLRQLNLTGNNIAGVDLNNLDQLTTCQLSGNLLRELDLPNTSNLETLDISLSGSLIPDLSNQLVLQELSMVNKTITTVDLSANSMLERFFADGSDLAQVDFTNNQLLKIVSVSRTDIATIDTSILSNLERLRVAFSLISSLNTSSNNNLWELDLSGSNVSSIDLSSNGALKYLRLNSTSVTSLDITNNTLLEAIEANQTPITAFDARPAINLTDLSFRISSLSSLDVSTNALLIKIDVYASQLTTIDVSNCSALNQLFVNNSNLTGQLDTSNNPNLATLNCSQNDLTSVNVKNGAQLGNSVFSGNPNLQYICADDFEIQSIYNYLTNFGQTSVQVNDLCSFIPGGDPSLVNGTSRFSFNNNNCSTTDPAASQMRYEISDGINTTNHFGDDLGAYLIAFNDGIHSVTPIFENPNIFISNPPQLNLNFPTQTSPFTQDFCVTANGTIEDLEIIVVPLEQARPGFDTDYKVVVKNKGNQTSSGSVTLDFEEDFMTLLSSNPNAGNTPSNQLSWSFSNLQPFQMSAYEFTMRLNTPTATVNPLNSNDILTFTGTVTGTGTDAMPADNVMVLDQTVVNSYDPNDKTCLEGATITPALVGEYVHYMIRFENTGTASAINVVIKDEIDLAQFDITTLIPLGGSHEYYTRVRDTNVVEFIHENINLDFNDATNDGYVLFKIKTRSTLIEGDAFDNTAEIYFDFNFPIITNTETVTVMSTASIGETTDTSIAVYPNPARDLINISSLNGLKSATLIDVNGRRLSQTNFIGNTTEQRISLENLTSGVYFVTIQSDLGQKVEKVIVE
jgi:hypothetical protein